MQRPMATVLCKHNLFCKTYRASLSVLEQGSVFHTGFQCHSLWAWKTQPAPAAPETTEGTQGTDQISGLHNTFVAP